MTSTRSAGTDTTTVNDLSGTDVKKVYVDLAGGDRRHRPATASPTRWSSTRPPGDDEIDIRPRSGRAVVDGLAAKVAVAHPEAANDSLTVNALGGEDEIHLGAGLGGLIKTSVNA